MSKLEKIEVILKLSNQPDYRLQQIKQAVYKNGCKCYSEISNLPLELRESLQKEMGTVLEFKVIGEIKGNQVHKVLLETKDDQRIESVLIKYKPNKERHHDLYSVCVSSQAGCGMGCKFCSTGAIGFKRNLEADEIVDQVLFFKQQGIDVTNIIFMGMGEPFANSENVFKAVKILIDPDLFGLSPRKISISTVGVVPGIERLTKEMPHINLALSLHSPFQEEREKIMPVSQAYPLDKLMKAVGSYVETTNNKIFISYLLLKDYNDDTEHALALSKLIKNQGNKSYLYHVNLIRFNPGPTSQDFETPSPENISNFQRVLTDHHIENTLRQDFGVEIDAACGQLYAKYNHKE